MTTHDVAGSPAASHIGDLALLERRLPLLGLFCSVRCPGQIILRLADLAGALREAGVAAVGGFHAPMEREALALLLRGRQPVVVCPARGVAGMRLPRAWRAPVEQGRLLVISPFAAGQRRATAALAERRNSYVAELARVVFIAHAAPGGQIERLAGELIAAGKPTLTFASEYNAGLLALGARGVSIESAASAVEEIRAALAGEGQGSRP